jgi:hypothetical protein
MDFKVGERVSILTRTESSAVIKKVYKNIWDAIDDGCIEDIEWVDLQDHNYSLEDNANPWYLVSFDSGGGGMYGASIVRPSVFFNMN